MINLKDPFVFFEVLIISNLVAYALNIVFSKVWDKMNHFTSSISKQEINNSLLNLFINIIIAIPGYLLWSHDFITFTNTHFLISFIGVFFLMDFLMYFLHWFSHNIPLLKKIHAKHHEHTAKFNCVSLYYMSPWESILFGLLLTVVSLIFHLNLYSFILFLFFNWFYGVATHLNAKESKSFFLIFTTNTFHKNHHELSVKNYGFYTFIWDRFFNTEKKF